MLQARKDWEGLPVSATSPGFATCKYADAAMRGSIRYGSVRAIGAKDRPILSVIPGRQRSERTGTTTLVTWRTLLMRTLQPAEWAKPRGFSHGVAVDGPGRWIVLAGQTGGDEKGEYQSDMAGQVGMALRRIIKLLGEAGGGPEHIVRLTWYLTSRSEYEAAGAGIGAAWRETLGRNFPPSTLLYISGLVDVRAKVEIEVTAFVPGV
jgi:enamine deaminase RidA (YjgF/YER057c/UK114 family)